MSCIGYISPMSHMSHITSVSNGPPTPEEFQRQLSDFMRQHFQRTGAHPATEPADARRARGPRPASQG